MASKHFSFGVNCRNSKEQNDVSIVCRLPSSHMDLTRKAAELEGQPREEQSSVDNAEAAQGLYSDPK